MPAPDPETPRDLGPLVVSERLARVLAELRRREGVGAAAEVDADRLHAVEVAVGYRFADDLLATWAASVPLLTRECRFSLDKVVANTGSLADAGAPGDLIGLGMTRDGLVALEKRAAAGDETELLLYRGDRGGDRREPLVAWLEARLDELPPAAEAGAPGGFTPRLTRKPPTGSSGRRVRHPVFGEGRVYLEIGKGPDRKVKVDFPKVGLKILQARFLEDVED